MNSEETGYRAAALLDKLMTGRRPPKRLPEIRPAGVIIRRSTDVLATEIGTLSEQSGSFATTPAVHSAFPMLRTM